MRISSKDRIASVPIMEVRKLLRRTAEFEWAASTVALTLRITDTGAERLIQAMLRRGLISRVTGRGHEPRFCNTVKGNALALASAAKPVLRRTAEKALEELLGRVHRVNHEASFLYRVTEVRVFGSYLTDVARMSDVDVAIRLVPKESDGKVNLARGRRRVAAARRTGRTFSTYIDELLWPYHEVILFLKNRRRILSLHVDDNVLQITESRLLFSDTQARGARKVGAVKVTSPA